MKWHPYPKYKPSGVEWLGEIPEPWDILGCKFGYSIQLGKMLQNEPQTGKDELVPYLKAFHVNWEKVKASELPEMWASPGDIQKYSVREGDLLVCEGGEGGRAGILKNPPSKCIIQNALHRVRPRKDNSNQFLMYFLEVVSHRGWFDILCNKATIAHFTAEKFGWLSITLPPSYEQRSIAAFLDRETTRIDALMEKKQRQIELLQEKRAALITHAVTKGLDPTAPMKDSGIEWFDHIPAHWELKRLKFLASEPLKYGANESAEIDDPDLPRYIRITDITEGGSLRDDTFKSLPEDVAEPFLLEHGDILLARSGATAGKTFMYQDSWGRACYAGYLIRVRTKPIEAIPQFLSYFTNSSVYWGWLSSVFIQATIQNVSAEKYANMIMSSPPIDEQKEIVAFLDHESAKINTLIGKVQESIDSLKEYRTALISAAVTGQIDVREEAA